MKNNNVNNFWNAFSRGLCVALLTIAAFCGICGLGAALNQIPWLLIAGGICLLLIISAAIWFLGYMSRKVTPTKGKYEAPKNEVITVEPIGPTEGSTETSYRVRRKVFDFDEGQEVPAADDIIDAED